MSSPETADRLRAAKPAASLELRERIRELAALAPEPAAPRPAASWGSRLRPRRAVLVLVPICVAAIAAGALVDGLVTSGPPRPEAFSTVTTSGAAQAPAAPQSGNIHTGVRAAATPAPDALKAAGAASSGGGSSAGSAAGALPPATSRLQDYQAAMTLRVKNADALSAATKQALRITRELGGYVVAVSYDAGGEAALQLRVPVGKVQAAVVRYSALGTIVSQQISIQDLQARADDLDRRTAAQRGRIAVLVAKLADPRLAEADRPALQQELDAAQARLVTLVRARSAVSHEARYAKVSLYLETKHAVVAPQAAPPGRLGRAAHEARGVLEQEGVVLLWIVIVAGPILLVAAVLLTGDRRRRRRADERLLGT